MSERIAPYWTGNVVQLRLAPKPSSTGPDNTANQFDQAPDQKPVAKVLQLTTSKKKRDAPQP